jgi:hypothetical protein
MENIDKKIALMKLEQDIIRRAKKEVKNQLRTESNRIIGDVMRANNKIAF